MRGRFVLVASAIIIASAAVALTQQQAQTLATTRRRTAAAPAGDRPTQVNWQAGVGAGDRSGGERFAGVELEPLPEGPRRLHADLQRQGPDGMACQPLEYPRHDTRLSRPSRRARRNAAPIGQRRHSDHRRSTRDFELYMEVNPDWGCDSGLFFRATETGVAYQVTLDYLPTGIIGNVNGENGLQGVGGGRGGAAAGGRGTSGRAEGGAVPQLRGVSADQLKAWKRGEWNVLRLRVEGEVPRVRLWVNDE